MSKKTTADIILETTKNLVQDKSSRKLTMRKIASGSGIALGTIYNYYKNKDEIIIALVKDFWNKSIQEMQLICEQSNDFTTALAEIYSYLIGEFSQFQDNWLELLQSINKDSKQEGLRTEKEIFTEMHRIISELLLKHHPESWKDISKIQLANFISEHIISSLINSKENIDFLIELLEIIIKTQSI